MKKTIASGILAAAIATGFAGAAAADGAFGPHAKPFVTNPSYVYNWKYDYRPRHVCKHHYRWVYTRFGWRQVYVGYRCTFTNNF